MAFLTGSFQSRQLTRKVSFTAIIPTSTSSIYDPETSATTTNQPLKTLYLLHGWDGNHEDWLQNTRVVELAIKHHVAVIMPDGQNSFYVNHQNGNKYGNYIGEELVEETRRLFPLSTHREDTSIGGLSMGGYGALRNGLSYPETFGNILAFSSKLLTRSSKELFELDNPIQHQLRSIINGSSTETMPEEMDIEQLALKNQAGNMTHLYLACGTEDDLIGDNRSLHQFLLDQRVDHHYVEVPGKHDWDVWNTLIEQSMEWLYENRK